MNVLEWVTLYFVIGVVFMLVVRRLGSTPKVDVMFVLFWPWWIVYLVIVIAGELKAYGKRRRR